jgi:hypothetical protein
VEAEKYWKLNRLRKVPTMFRQKGYQGNVEPSRNKKMENGISK